MVATIRTFLALNQIQIIASRPFLLRIEAGQNGVDDTLTYRYPSNAAGIKNYVEYPGTFSLHSLKGLGYRFTELTDHPEQLANAEAQLDIQIPRDARMPDGVEQELLRIANRARLIDGLETLKQAPQSSLVELAADMFNGVFSGGQSSGHMSIRVDGEGNDNGEDVTTLGTILSKMFSRPTKETTAPPPTTEEANKPPVTNQNQQD